MSSMGCVLRSIRRTDRRRAELSPQPGTYESLCSRLRNLDKQILRSLIPSRIVVSLSVDSQGGGESDRQFAFQSVGQLVFGEAPGKDGDHCAALKPLLFEFHHYCNRHKIAACAMHDEALYKVS